MTSRLETSNASSSTAYRIALEEQHMAAMCNVSSNLSALIGFVPGAVGGVCNVVTGHPFDLVKVRQQCAAPSVELAGVGASRVTTSSMLRSIVAHEGLMGLYAGVSAPLLAVVPAFGITFWSFDVAKSYQLKGEQRPLTIRETAVGGAYSGLPLALVLGPLEKMKCTMQVEPGRYRSTGDCLRQSLAESGVRGVFRGTFLTMCRDVPGNAAYFTGYEVVRRQLWAVEGGSKPSMGTTLMAGGLAGVFNWIVAIPVDVVKSRWQVAPVGTYASPLAIVRILLREEGSAAFFKGLSPALLRAFPANAACLLGVETARGFLGME